MTTNNNDKFNFANKEAFIAMVLDARSSQAAMEAELEAHQAYMSDLAKAGLETYGTTGSNGKRSLILDLGDGSERGHIIAQRGDLYFIRERNSGRPAGSKNKKTASSKPAAAKDIDESPSIVVEESSTVTASETEVPEPKRKTPFEIALEVAEQEEREAAEAAEAAAAEGSNDPVIAAFLKAQETTVSAIREHVRSTHPSPAE